MISLHLSNTNINHDGRIKKEIEALRKSTLNLTVLGYGAHQVEDRTRADYGRSEDNIRTVSLIGEKLIFLPRSFKYVFMLLEFTIKATFYGLSIRPNVVHCHDTFALPAGVLLRFCGAKVIYDAHELESNKNGQSRMLSWATLAIERVCWSHVSGFITVSQKILEWYQLKFSAKHSVTILNAPPKRKNMNLHSDTSDLKEKFNIGGQSNIYVYVGILSSGRGIEKLLRIFSRPGNSHIVFLGYGPLQDKIAEYANNMNRIHLHPPVPHNEVVNTISSANFGFCIVENTSLSDYLCLPNKLFEYAQAGITVIGSKFPEISEVLDRHNLGLTVEDDEKEIESMVNDLDNNGYVCNPLALDELAWEAQEKKLLKFYEEVINKS